MTHCHLGKYVNSIDTFTRHWGECVGQYLSKYVDTNLRSLIPDFSSLVTSQHKSILISTVFWLLGEHTDRGFGVSIYITNAKEVSSYLCKLGKSPILLYNGKIYLNYFTIWLNCLIIKSSKTHTDFIYFS